MNTVQRVKDLAAERQLSLFGLSKLCDVPYSTIKNTELDADSWSNQMIFQSCFKADIVRSGTGAGDTSIAAFLAAVLSGREPSSCIALASAEGACCVTAYDALSGLKPLDELEERIHKGW